MAPIDMRPESFSNLYPLDGEKLIEYLTGPMSSDDSIVPFDGYKQSLEGQNIPLMVCAYEQGQSMYEGLDPINFMGACQDMKQREAGSGILQICIGEDRGAEGIFFVTYPIDMNSMSDGRSVDTAIFCYHLLEESPGFYRGCWTVFDREWLDHEEVRPRAAAEGGEGGKGRVRCVTAQCTMQRNLTAQR